MSKKLVGRELNYETAKEKLEKKSVNFTKGLLDISNAHDLGNSSWGLIDYISKEFGIAIIGWDSHFTSNK